MTSRCSPAQSDLDRCRGFTLIEVIVTLAILGFALVLVTGYKPPWSSGLGLNATAAELASGLRLARSEAIVRNRSVAFSLDLTGHRYRVGTGTERPLPANFSLELLTIAGASTPTAVLPAAGSRWPTDSGASPSGSIG